MIAHILCATNLSPHADEALRIAVHMAAKYNAKLTMLNVHEEFMDKDEMVMLRVSVEQMQEHFREIAIRCREQMKQLVTAVGVDDLQVEYLLREGSAAKEILEIAAELGAKLPAHNTVIIVLGIHAKEGLVGHLLGSVADHVVRYATCPVLVIPYEVD